MTPSFAVLGTIYGAPQQKQTFEDWLKPARVGSQYVYATCRVLDAKTPPEVQKKIPLVNGIPWQITAYTQSQQYRSRDWR